MTTDEEIQDKIRRWQPVLDAIFSQPELAQSCPYCGDLAVRASWSLYSDEHRAASFDAQCAACKQEMHASIFLPPHAPDAFPPGTVKPAAEATKRMFKEGRKRGWW
jgi:hypothetical protein